MLLDSIHEDLKNSQLERSELKTSALRMLLSEIKNAEIALRQSSGQSAQLSDEDIISVIQKEVKKRKEAAIGFRQGNREESAAKEEQEAVVLEKYLPAQISDEELERVVVDAISQTGAVVVSDMGKVIGVVMPQVKGQADGGRVSALVKEKLGS